MADKDLKTIVKRIVTPAKPDIVVDTSINTPEQAMEEMLADGLGVLKAEIFRYKAKVSRGQSLDLKEARIVQGYIKCMIDMRKENRENDEEDDNEDFSKLTNEQLIQLLKKSKK